MTSMLSDMEHTGHYLHLAFLMATVFSLSSATEVNYTHLWANNSTVSDPDIQNKTGRNQNENINKNPATPEIHKNAISTNMPKIATSAHIIPLIPKLKLEPFTTPDVRNSSTIQSNKNTSKNHSGILKNSCEENNYRMAMLVCLIVIAVLFLICTILFLSTVVLANKVSSLKRANQVGKRQPRSNGDFLACSGLWPAESDTWKRAQQLTGPNLMMQSPGVLTMTRERKDGEGTRKLTN
ncbi:protein EVI2A [Sorex araneus]|uniref:protein EVI2A n=1 Tax=Sorex araneus TaxID=42254 RepID=UPI00064AC1EB|nr:protein EVI2A [Sorex araneus]